jgi:DHH family
MTRLITRDYDPAIARRLAATGMPAPLARVLAARGVTRDEDLRLSLEGLAAPAALAHVDAAASLLADAIEADARLLIVADYDCDGATACAVGLRGLRMLAAGTQATVDYLVPNRFEYGYGLTPEIVELAAQREPDLLITVDNGIASVEGVARAGELGIEVLITDHHLPGAALPAAACIVNPNQPGRASISPGSGSCSMCCWRCVPSCAHAAASMPPRSRGSTLCSTWSRSARSRTSCGSTTTTACWSRRDCSGSAADGCIRASPRCSRSPAGMRAPRARRIWALHSARGSMPPGA